TAAADNTSYQFIQKNFTSVPCTAYSNNKCTARAITTPPTVQPMIEPMPTDAGSKKSDRKLHIHKPARNDTSICTVCSAGARVNIRPVLSVFLFLCASTMNPKRTTIHSTAAATEEISGVNVSTNGFSNTLIPVRSAVSRSGDRTVYSHSRNGFL